MRQAVDTSQGPEGSLWSSLLSPTLTAAAGDTEEPGRHPPAWPPCGSEPGAGSVGGCDERLCRLAAGRARSGGHTVSPDRPCPAVPGSGCCRSLASGRGPSSASCPRGAGLGVPAWSVETLGHGQHVSICAEPDAGGANRGWGVNSETLTSWLQQQRFPGAPRGWRRRLCLVSSGRACGRSDQGDCFFKLLC